MIVVSASLLLFVAGCSGAPKHKDVHKAAPQWCNPAEMWGSSDGWHQWHCVPDANGPAGKKGHIEEDKQAEAAIAEYDMHKADLAEALTTRVLTPAEMHEVLSLGARLYISEGQPFYEEDIRKQFLAALDVQRELRLMAEDEKKQK